MTENHLAMHPDWRRVVAGLSVDDNNRLYSIARLYDSVCGVGLDDLFTNESVNEACHDLARTSPLYGHKVPTWNRDECAKLMASRTLLPMKTCEAFVDSELINTAIAAGELPDSEPAPKPKSTLTRDEMTAEQIVEQLYDTIRVVAFLENVTVEVMRLDPPDADGCNWSAKHSGVPRDCPPKTLRLYFELVQLSRDAFTLVD